MLPARDLILSGVRSVVYDSRPDGGPEAVVFVHGNPGPMDDWAELAPAVAAHARVIAMDLPGYGRAEHPARFDFSVHGYARYLGELLDALSVARVHLVLHDFGGPFGLAWAVEHPAKFASVTLINTGVLKGYHWHKYARIWQTPVIGELFQLFGSAKAMKRALDHDNPKPLPWEWVERIHSYADWNHKRAVLELYRASRDTDRLAEPIGRELLKLGRPACVIWGEKDPYLPVAMAEAQREYFKQIEVHLLPGLGHWPFIDDLPRVRAPLIDFLLRQLALAS